MTFINEEIVDLIRSNVASLDMSVDLQNDVFLGSRLWLRRLIRLLTYVEEQCGVLLGTGQYPELIRQLFCLIFAQVKLSELAASSDN